MAVLVRTLLIWLLMLAVPVQGAAAATMAFCGPKHHDRVAVAGDAATASHSHPGAWAGVAHEHSRADATRAAPPGSDAHGIAATVKAETKAVSTDAHKCNVCGSCCSMGAPVGTLPALPAVEAMSTTFSPVVATVDPFSADGPDRPPRAARV